MTADRKRAAESTASTASAGLNLLLCGGLTLTLWSLQYFAARQVSWLAVLGLGAVSALLQAPNYSLMHEGFHRVLHPAPGLNYALGFLQSLHFPGSFTFMQACHLGHHRRNRTDAEMFDCYYPGESRRQKQAQFYALYLGGFWLLPVLSLFILVLWPGLLRNELVRDAPAARAMVDGLPRRYLARIRLESFTVIAAHTALFLALELRWSSYLLLYACHGICWSAHNYLAHAHSPRSVTEGAFNIALPRPLSAALLNFNYHLAHHQHPRAPWRQLPELSDPSREPLGYIAAHRRFWKGPVETTQPPPRGLPKEPARNATSGRSSKRLAARVVQRSSLSDLQRSQMWELFQQYYDRVTRAAFAEDLEEKSHVILLEDRNDQKLQGFSTLLLERERVESRQVNVLFSGDTIVNRLYWGDKSLQKAFVRFLVRCKLRAPFTPLYWLLLTKGYKTYLLLTRNFPVHFPRHDTPTPKEYSQLMDRVCTRRYGAAWHASEGIVRFDQSHGQLKPGIAPVPGSLAHGPEVSFFLDRNPGHEEGDELVCLGAATWRMFLFFTTRLAKRRRHPAPSVLPHEATGRSA